jgi:hypothetical protein
LLRLTAFLLTNSSFLVLYRQSGSIFLVVSPLHRFLQISCFLTGMAEEWRSVSRQQALSYKYVLEWMGRSSSTILDMYFTMNDRYAQAAMNSLSFNSGKIENRTVLGQSGTQFCETLPQPTHL